MHKIVVAILVLGCIASLPALAQGTLDQDAIVWTGMQQPVPEPAQDLAAREIPPAQQGAQQSTERSPEQREQPSVQRPEEAGQQSNPTSNQSAPTADATRSLTGTIVRENSGYFLRTDDNSEYQLDDTTKVRSFENQAVRITGTVESSTRTIHVQTVQPES